mgnify:FL=1
MKIYISFDMEGMACVTHGWQIPGDTFANELREQVTDELNAIIEGAARAGATEFYVNDTHARANPRRVNHCIPARLHPQALYLGGWGIPFPTVEGLDESFSALLLVRQHAMAGHPTGDLSHTWVRTLVSVRLNEQPIGEIGRASCRERV